jgi:hypothetical protein
LIIEASRDRDWAELSKQLSSFEKIRERSAATGWLWGGYCQATIPTKAAFQVPILDKNGTRSGTYHRLENMPTNITRVPNVKSITHAVAYYKIEIIDPATFDACSITNDTAIIYKFTINPDHELRPNGFDELATALGKDHPQLLPWVNKRNWLLVWVVPYRIRDKMKAKTIKGGGRKWNDYIDQYVLGLRVEKRPR